MLKILAILAIFFSCSCCLASSPTPEDPVTLRINLFRGSSNIPIYMAIKKGYFKSHGIIPLIEFTPNSAQQRTGLAQGKFDIAQSAVDNAVAMRANSNQPVVIVAGGDLGMNDFVVTSDLGSLQDLRGSTLIVDAPNTAYALLGRKILRNAGLEAERDYRLDAKGGSETRTQVMASAFRTATVLNPPWNLIAKENGAKSLGTTSELFGVYQAQGILVMQPWADGHYDALKAFLAAYIEGCRAVAAPAERDLTIEVLSKELEIDRHVAEQTYEELNTRGSGISKDCAIDEVGFNNVLTLRAQMEGQWAGNAPDSDQFLNLDYYIQALKSLGP